MYTIVDGLIDDKDIAAPSTQGADIGIKPKFVVLTASRSMDASAKVHSMVSQEKHQQTHVFINRSGQLTQFVPLNMKAYHVGASYFQGNSSLNKSSIGIMMDNYGDSPFNNQDRWGLDHSPQSRDDFWLINHVWWHKFTPEQLKTLRELLIAIDDEYHIRDVLTADMAADTPGLGPLFPIEDMRAITRTYNADAEGYFVVTADSAEVSLGPDPAFDIVEKLQRGTSVRVLVIQDQWALALFGSKLGWIHLSMIMKT